MFKDIKYIRLKGCWEDWTFLLWFAERVEELDSGKPDRVRSLRLHFWWDGEDASRRHRCVGALFGFLPCCVSHQLPQGHLHLYKVWNTHRLWIEAYLQEITSGLEMHMMWFIQPVKETQFIYITASFWSICDIHEKRAIVQKPYFSFCMKLFGKGCPKTVAITSNLKSEVKTKV